MPLDISTLLVAVTLATAFCAAARLLLWRMHPTLAGLGRWALAGGGTVCSFILIFCYGKFHWPPALSLAQFFVVVSLVLSWDGFRRFLGKTSLSPLPLSYIIVLSALAMLLVPSHSSLATKAIANALLTSALSFFIAKDLLLSASPLSTATRATGYVYALNGGVFLVRAMMAPNTPSLINPLSPHGMAAFMLLWLLGVIIAITLGMVLMTTERLQADLDKQANQDPLTGALNRRACGLLYEKAIAQARRHQQPLSVLMIDLDHFKKVNDQLGHAVGDNVLCHFVSVAQSTLREEDIFCRFGGEEFVALLPNTSMAAALGVANRLRLLFAIDSSLLTSNQQGLPFTITASIGIAELQAEEELESLLRRADGALYKAKDHGRNRCELSE